MKVPNTLEQSAAKHRTVVATLFDLDFIWRDVQEPSYLPRLSSGHLGVGKSSYAIINYEGYKQYKLAIALHPQFSWL